MHRRVNSDNNLYLKGDKRRNVSLDGKLVEIIVVNNPTKISTNKSEYIITVISQLDFSIKGTPFQQDKQLR